MDTQAIGDRLSKAASTPRARRMPRGMLDTLAPQIYQATKSGMSLHDIRRHFEATEGLLVTVASISQALKRNGFVPSGANNPNSHNV